MTENSAASVGPLKTSDDNDNNKQATTSKWYLTKRTVHWQLLCVVCNRVPTIGYSAISHHQRQAIEAPLAHRHHGNDKKRDMECHFFCLMVFFFFFASHALFVLLFRWLPFVFVFNVCERIEHIVFTACKWLRRRGFGFMATDTCVIMQSDLSFGGDGDLGLFSYASVAFANTFGCCSAAVCHSKNMPFKPKCD